MKGHWIWMVLGCGIPLLLIFFAPALGITGYNGLFAFIILMFAIHLFMPHGAHGHSGHNHSQHEQSESQDTDEKPLAKPKDEHKGHQHH
ncbi:hypothetical protein [Mariniflexile sp.]|uniref:hypothetical protein n=1 Tax=Mariniflexile sp. TaxID=1979402 RepID=UPI004047D30C